MEDGEVYPRGGNTEKMKHAVLRKGGRRRRKVAILDKMQNPAAASHGRVRVVACLLSL